LATNYKKVASVACVKCHKQAFKDYVKSPHGKGYLKGDPRVPTCTRCHGSHYVALIRDDKAASYYMNAPKELCGHCHEEAYETYAESYHGKTLIALKYNKTPGCPQCHDPHKADKLDTPEKQIEACKQCHLNANKNFVGYDVHANENDRIKEPVLFYSKWSMTFLLLGTFAFFYPHSVLWALRERKERRERAEAEKGDRKGREHSDE
jgi:NAD-dependent SIR2 family protein deacetylase